MRYPKFAFAVVFLTLTPVAPAQAGEFVDITESTTGTITRIDISTLRGLPAYDFRRPFPVREIWVEHDYSKNKTETASSAKGLMRFDCVGSRAATISFTQYDSNGSVLRSRSDPTDSEYDYQPVVPGSIGSAINDVVCS